MASTVNKNKTRKQPLNPPREYERLGKKIRKLRKEQEMTQEDLALKAKVSSVYVGYIETALRTPSLQILRKIAKALGVSLEELFK
jgi:transcriptional regulator with XRE-family HTH domain